MPPPIAARMDTVSVMRAPAACALGTTIFRPEGRDGRRAIEGRLLGRVLLTARPLLLEGFFALPVRGTFGTDTSD